MSRAVNGDPSSRFKQIHIRITEDEWKNLRVVTTHAGVGISDYCRPAIFERVERDIDRRRLRDALPRRSQSAPALAQK